MRETISIHRIIVLLTLLLLLLTLGDAHGWPWSRREAPARFADAPAGLRPALQAFAEQRWEEGLAGCWSFLAGKQGHEAGYALAQLHMAEAAEALGLKQLATETYADIVRDGMDPRVSLQALDALEGITHEPVYDEQTVVEELIYEKEFGLLPQRLNNFVQYYQALMDFRNGYPRWASRHGEKIQGKDEYFYRFRILEALWALKEDRVDECREVLEIVVEDEGVPKEVRNEAKKALARVAYEQGDFSGAYRLYRAIDAPELSLADVILEEAWTKYRAGDYRKAMGLLVAFSAPAFQGLFKPEQYLLRALIYMQYCHYGAAQAAIGSFKDRYGDILADIRQRADLTDNPHARRILEQVPSIQRIDAYLKELEQEEALLEGLEVPGEMVKEIQPMYVLKRMQVYKRRERVWNREVERLKRALFDYEEQANLVAYESGMDQYKKVKKMYYQKKEPGGRTSPESRIPRLSRETYYTFDGEFWSDELDDYTFFIEDYCNMPERWLQGMWPQAKR